MKSTLTEFERRSSDDLASVQKATAIQRPIIRRRSMLHTYGPSRHNGRRSRTARTTTPANHSRQPPATEEADPDAAVHYDRKKEIPWRQYMRDRGRPTTIIWQEGRSIYNPRNVTQP